MGRRGSPRCRRAGRGAATRVFVGDRREPAHARVGADRRRPLREAADTLLELFDQVLAAASPRGARCSRPPSCCAENASWGVARGDRAVPAAGRADRQRSDGLARLPHIDVTPMSRRDAIWLVRRALLEYLAEAGPPPAAAQIHGAATDVARLINHGSYWELEFAELTAHQAIQGDDGHREAALDTGS